jgi:polysaccharide deacetylase family protein (PEP-CTERM system associated)
VSSEVERNTAWLLELLGEAGVRATFFILGNVAQAFPSLVRRIARDNHELGIHGYDHKYICKITPGDFREEIKRARGEIQDLTGVQVYGHRAPAFSITRESFWAVDILRELGFLYDSSIYPVKARRYGIRDAQKKIYRWPNGLYEVPLSCIELLGKAVPVAGGGYIRHFPYWWTRFAVRRLERLSRPAVVYMHPYEFEASYPRLEQAAVPRSLRIHTMLQAHNRGAKQREKLCSLLADFTFIPLRDLIARHTHEPAE